MCENGKPCAVCDERKARMNRSKAICTGGADDHPACPRPLEITSGVDLSHRLAARQPERRSEKGKPVVRTRYVTPWTEAGLKGDAAWKRGERETARAWWAEAKRLYDEEGQRLIRTKALRDARRKKARDLDRKLAEVEQDAARLQARKKAEDAARSEREAKRRLRAAEIRLAEEELGDD